LSSPHAPTPSARIAIRPAAMGRMLFSSPNSL
jgi:hypothetical protein